MLLVQALTALVMSIDVAFSQSSPLLNPNTRFNDLELALPPVTYPTLQRDFTVPPDCGETSYRGSGRLSGRRALVTGGDSGIGRAIVIAFLREGASVAINYLPEEQPDVDDLREFLAAESLNITTIPGDLLNETFCADLVAGASSSLGGLDLVVNHAGYPGIAVGPDAPLINNHSTEQWDRVFRTNVYAPFWITRAAAPLLPAGSSIIFTTSDVAQNPLPRAVDYSATRAAIVNMVKSLAQQMQPLGVRVNGVAPGFVYTPFLNAQGYDTETMLDVVSNFPNPRMEQPAEIAPLYVGLAEEQASFTSGSIWGANGALGGF